jgi:hypothetical protein
VVQPPAARAVIEAASAFLVSRAGVVVWAHADEDFKTRPSADQLLANIDALMPTEK